MVSLGISWHGIGQVRISPMGTKINQQTYLEILENTYLQDCLEIFGPSSRTYIFMQDNASSHAPAWSGAADITQASAVKLLITSYSARARYISFRAHAFPAPGMKCRIGAG